MNEKSTAKKYTGLSDIPQRPLSKKGLSMTEAEIAKAAAEDPDAAPFLDKEAWADAEIIMPRGKKQITLRLDTDVLAWFKSRGKGYQTRINAVLRRYMEAREE